MSTNLPISIVLLPLHIHNKSYMYVGIIILIIHNHNYIITLPIIKEYDIKVTIIYPTMSTDLPISM